MRTRTAAAGPLEIRSPGFPPTVIDERGRLKEDWGPVGVTLHGEGVTEGTAQVRSTTLDGIVPAVEAVSDRGAVKLCWTVFRAPVFPSGVDVLTVRLAAARGKPAKVALDVPLPDGTQVGARSVRLGSRSVLTLPPDAVASRALRDWGSCDDATSLPGWAKPEGPCDPAFRNIRAGMGGVPIVYRFSVPPGSAARVVLGFCESHWAEPGQRPLTCQVEGAPPQEVDPVAAWGRHRPGALSFLGRDADNDGKLDVVVRSAPAASDQNPILNVVWVFPPGESPSLDRVIAGERNTAATYYVDAGGPKDQTIYPPGQVRYELDLPADGQRELTFLVACPGGSSPPPDASDWTLDRLRRAAVAVWRDWTPANRAR